MNSWSAEKRKPWSEKSIKLLLSISSLSPPVIVIDIKKGDKAWNPTGDSIEGPARISYTKIYDDVTVNVDRKAKKVKK